MYDVISTLFFLVMVTIAGIIISIIELRLGIDIPYPYDIYASIAALSIALVICYLFSPKLNAQRKADADKRQRDAQVAANNADAHAAELTRAQAAAARLRAAEGSFPDATAYTSPTPADLTETAKVLAEKMSKR
jgi:nucleoside permease NupC